MSDFKKSDGDGFWLLENFMGKLVAVMRLFIPNRMKNL